VRRILLLLPTATYRATDFLAAAGTLGVDVVVGSEHRQAMSRSMGDRAVVIPLQDVGRAVETIERLNARLPLDAVLAVDDQGLLIASASSSRLGFRHNPLDAVVAARDKVVMRERFALASIRQPEFRVVAPEGDVVAAAIGVGFPCVVKPVSRSASQGVIRVDDAEQARSAGERVRALLDSPGERLLVERFVPGEEVAVEGLLVSGRLEVLAVFDKPDPLDGPFFEETIYVTPSRQDPAVLADVERIAADATGALGLREGPVHVELRLGLDGLVTVLEVAARSIGGLCSRALRFGAGVSLEELIIRHALELPLHDLSRETQASGVMMLPIRASGVLEGVHGQDQARAVEGVVGLSITIAPGKTLTPLPEGDRYLGFIFARGPTPAFVEGVLRQAEACLDVRLR
jgi:biotin carboxylase